MLIDQIHSGFSYYRANFDLDDCDKILRVESVTDYVDSAFLIHLLDSFGFFATILPGDDPAETHFNSNLVVQTSVEF